MARTATKSISVSDDAMRCTRPDGPWGIRDALLEHQAHPPVVRGDIIGTAGHQAGDYFAVYANGGNNFVNYGIVEGTLLLVDRKLPFEMNALNVFNIAPDQVGKELLKISLVPIEGCKCVGRVKMALNQYR